MFDDLGGKREKRRIFLHRSVFFIARGSKISPRFLTLVAPLGLLISFISFSLLTDDDSILCLSLSFFFYFICFFFDGAGMRDRGRRCSLICAILSAFFRFQFSSPIHPFLSRPLCQHCIPPFSVFSMV